MAYVALYRAYRPQTFSEVCGQKHIVRTLQNAIKMDKVAHAYLFSGPRGTGKTTLAKIMAKALNCEKGVTTEPCNECAICQGINKGMIPDVIEIDAASNNGADDIRELREGIKFLPSVGRYKVYIIDEVHMLSTAAFNALLKTLEEPPKHVIFILATTEPYKLPNTILSRCQRFDFQAISTPDIMSKLKEVASKENIKINDEAVRLIAEYSEGGMRDALSLLDQTISYSTGDAITEDDVLAISGNTSYLTLLDLITACYSKSDTSAISILADLIKQGKEIPRILNDMIVFLRDILMVQNGVVYETKAIYKNTDFINFTKNIRSGIVYNWIDILSQTQNSIRFSNQKQAYLELAILKMSDSKLNDTYVLLDKFEQLEHDVMHLETLVKNYDEPKVEQNVTYDIPVVTKDDIKAFKDDTNEVKPELSVEKVVETKPTSTPVISESTDEYITISEVENILNNPDKAKKDKLKDVWNKLEIRYPNLVIIQILCKGEIVAASNDKFIVVLKDEGFCNRVMKYENFVKIIEIINLSEHLFDDYICLPKTIWEQIKSDYVQKYKNGITKPKLESINIPVKKRIIPSNGDNSDPFMDKVYELFDKDIVKVEEN